MSVWGYFENPRVVIEVEGSAGELPKIRGGCGNLAEKVPGGRGMGFGRGVAGVSSGWRPERPGGGVSTFRTRGGHRLTASGPPAILGRMTNSQLVIV